MDFQKLKYFVTIAEEKQISTAAQKLHIAQPPLSRMLKNLEEELGCALFVRNTRNMTLTKAGESLYERAKLILRMVEDTRQEVILVDKGIKGILSLGIIDSLIGEFSRNYISAYSKEHRQTTYNIFTGNTDDIIRAVQNQVVEFGIVRFPFDHEGFTCIPYKQTKLAAVIPKGMCMKEGPITIKELAQYSLAIHYRHKVLVEECFHSQGVEAKIKCIANDAKVIYEFANCGLGVSILPYMDDKIQEKGNVVYRLIEHPNMQIASSIIWRNERKLSKIATAFLEYL